MPPEAPATSAADTPAAPQSPEVSLDDVGLSAAKMDTAADPCVDFYQYACGGWLAQTEIPADRTSWNAFSEIVQRNENALKTILEKAATDEDALPAIAAAGDFYAACMDEEAVEAAGLSGIQSLLDAAAAIKRRQDLAPVMARLHAHAIFPVWNVSVDQDMKDPELVIAWFDQGGLGLPERGYYLRDDAESQKLRALYQSHVERMLALSGLAPKQAKQAAADVMKVETALARASKTPVEMRDVPALYNKIDAAGLNKTVRGFDWKAYFSGIGQPDLQHITVSGTKFFEGFDKALRSQSPRAWRHYLRWQILRSIAPALPTAFVDESFVLAQALGGQKQQQTRWKRCVDQTDAAVPHYLGQAFVAEMFGAEAKAAVERMVKGISEAFAEAVARYDWMTEETKQRALEKREMMAYLIGYPDEWKTHDFEVDRKAHAANTLAAQADHLAKQLAKAGKPVDRSEWLMSAPTVNAYYHPLKNHMAYPAGILQSPFFDVDASLAVNLGGLGMIAGHELTHGFDDQGSQFAGSGALENWWQPADAEKFEARTQCVVAQYSEYEPLPGMKLNGQLTLGENVADMGGVKLAYNAYKKLSDGQQVVAGGFDEDEQFFLAVAQAWCGKRTEERMKVLLQTDPHSPAEFRVNGSLANMPEFASAFECKKGTPMNRQAICSVW